MWAPPITGRDWKPLIRGISLARGEKADHEMHVLERRRSPIGPENQTEHRFQWNDGPDIELLRD